MLGKGASAANEVVSARQSKSVEAVRRLAPRVVSAELREIRLRPIAVGDHPPHPGVAGRARQLHEEEPEGPRLRLHLG
jgi:hypothetical protein